MITAMQLMLDDLLSKREVYENAKMYECVATLTTSIEIAEYLLEKEKEQIIEAHFEGWSDAYDYLKDDNSAPRQAEDYYNEYYNQKQ